MTGVFLSLEKLIVNDTNPIIKNSMMDANDAVASVAYRASEVIAIYPITPSSGMAELCDEWSAAGKENIWSEQKKGSNVEYKH